MSQPDDIDDDVPQEKRKDVRVIVNVKNAFILRKMEEMGIKSVSQLSRLAGLSMTHLGAFVNMKKPARRVNDDSSWRTAVLKLAEFFRCLPEDLFSNAQQYQGLKTNVASRDVSLDDIKVLIDSSQPRDPEQILLEHEGMMVLNEILHQLTPREHRMVSLRFGLDGNGERTLQDVSEIFNVCRERARQIESKAIRKLKKPTRSRPLREYAPHIVGYTPWEDK